MAILVAAEVIPVLLFGPVAGVVIDRFSRKSVLIGADLVRAGLVLSLLWPQGVWHAYVVAAGLAAGNTFFNPTVQAVIPVLTTEQQRLAANSVAWSTGRLVQILASALAGGLIAVIGTEVAFGLNAAGGNEAFAGIVGTAVVRVFDLEVGRTGLTEQEATAAGLACMVTTMDSTDHAGYLPDARALTIKLVAEHSTGRVLGGQAVGYGGVAKRIDVLATALYADAIIDDLTRLDLAYAPPFNSVWDPVQVAATALRQRGL